MALEERTVLRTVEIQVIGDRPVILEYRNEILRDGEIVTSVPHRVPCAQEDLAALGADAAAAVAAILAALGGQD